MSNSDKQFRELLAQLIARLDRALSEGNQVLPIAMLLMTDGSLDASVAIFDSEDQIPGLVEAIRESLSEKVLIMPAVASCIAYPSASSGGVIAFLENRENYCAKFTIPLANQPHAHVDLEGIVVEEGTVGVFAVGA